MYLLLMYGKYLYCNCYCKPGDTHISNYDNC